MTTPESKPIVYNGSCTIVNERTGEHRTFNVRTKKLDADFAPGERVVSLLTGPDNTRDYTGFGFVKQDGIVVWRKKVSADPTKPSPFQVYAKMIWSLSRDGERSPFYLKGYRLKFERKCLKCNRKLTDPISIDMGIGPECRAKGTS